MLSIEFVSIVIQVSELWFMFEFVSLLHVCRWGSGVSLGIRSRSPGEGHPKDSPRHPPCWHWGAQPQWPRSTREILLVLMSLLASHSCIVIFLHAKSPQCVELTSLFAIKLVPITLGDYTMDQSYDKIHVQTLPCTVNSNIPYTLSLNMSFVTQVCCWRETGMRLFVFLWYGSHKNDVVGRCTWHLLLEVN